MIAAINGAAVAGGLTLALACDFRIAAESARLGDTSLKFALIPDEGGAYFFPRAMGMDRALKMSLLSEIYPARQALELGTGDRSGRRCGVDGSGARRWRRSWPRVRRSRFGSPSG